MNTTKNPKSAYSKHKCSAKQRGIEFLFTYDEWWSVWKNYFHMRGRGTNGLCMARQNDCGPYSIENVYLTTNLGNLQDYHKSKKAKEDRSRSKIAAYEEKIKARPLWGRRDIGGSDKVFKDKLKNIWDQDKEISLQDEIDMRLFVQP